MRCEGNVTIFQDFYKGTAKAGPYLSGNVKAKDGDFEYWLPVFISGQAFKVMDGAPMGAEFSIAGGLAMNSRKKDGETFRTLQVKVFKASRVGESETNKYANDGITDDDLPF